MDYEKKVKSVIDQLQALAPIDHVRDRVTVTRLHVSRDAMPHSSRDDVDVAR